MHMQLKNNRCSKILSQDKYDIVCLLYIKFDLFFKDLRWSNFSIFRAENDRISFNFLCFSCYSRIILFYLNLFMVQFLLFKPCTDKFPRNVFVFPVYQPIIPKRAKIRFCKLSNICWNFNLYPTVWSCDFFCNFYFSLLAL